MWTAAVSLWLVESYWAEMKFAKECHKNPQKVWVTVICTARIHSFNKCQRWSHQDMTVKCHSSSHCQYRTFSNHPTNSSRYCTGRLPCCQHRSPRLSKSHSPRGVAPRSWCLKQGQEKHSCIRSATLKGHYIEIKQGGQWSEAWWLLLYPNTGGRVAGVGVVADYGHMCVFSILHTICLLVCMQSIYSKHIDGGPAFCWTLTSALDS